MVKLSFIERWSSYFPLENGQVIFCLKESTALLGDGQALVIWLTITVTPPYLKWKYVNLSTFLWFKQSEYYDTILWTTYVEIIKERIKV